MASSEGVSDVIARTILYAMHATYMKVNKYFRCNPLPFGYKNHNTGGGGCDIMASNDLTIRHTLCASTARSRVKCTAG